MKTVKYGKFKCIASFIAGILPFVEQMEFPIKFDTVKLGWSIVYLLRRYR